MKRKLHQIKLPFQIQIDDVIGRSGFVVNTQGVTEISQEGGTAIVKRDGKRDLVFSGNFYGTLL